MESKELVNASFESKPTKKIPKGATIKRKSVNVSIREIENGYIIRKSFDINYEIKNKSDYLYYTEEVYTKENPLKKEENKMLADLFDD